jgi:tetratricopeptide (TPR) repeat protein
MLAPEHFGQRTSSEFMMRLSHARLLVFSYARLIWCFSEMGVFAEGRSYSEDGIRLAESTVNHYDRVTIYCSLGYLTLRQGDPEQAIAFLERSLELSRSASLRTWIPRVMAILGAAYTLAGRTEAALSLLEQSEHAIFQGHIIDQTLRIIWLGEIFLLSGRQDEALLRAQHALELSQNQGEQGQEAWALRLLGDIAMRRDPPEAEQAETHCQHALTLANALGMRPLQAHCHRGLGKLYSQTGQTEQARTELSTAIAMYRDMEMNFWIPETETALSAVEGKA